MEQTPKHCPDCGTELECKLQNFSIGADGGGGLMSLLADQYEVDLYACPECGRVLLYSAGFRPKAEESEEEVPEAAEPEEPQEEPEDSQPAPSMFSFGKRKKKGPKPPWER